MKNAGDRVIYNTRFGYDLGYFIAEGGVYDTYLLELASGKFSGKSIAASKSTVSQYSDELRDLLAEEYGYRLEWPA